MQSGRLFSGKQNRSDVQRNRLIPRSWVQVFNSLLAQQVLFLNKLIQRCLKEDWGLVCQEDGIEQQTICCFVFGGWTDQWKRCEVLLDSYHIEIAPVHRPLARGHMDGLTRPRSKQRIQCVMCLSCSNRTAAQKRSDLPRGNDEVREMSAGVRDCPRLLGRYGLSACPRNLKQSSRTKTNMGILSF